MKRVAFPTTYIPPKHPRSAWPPRDADGNLEETGQSFVPPPPIPTVQSSMIRTGPQVYPLTDAPTWVQPGTPLPTPSERPNHVNLHFTHARRYPGQNLHEEGEQGDGDPILPYQPLDDAFGQGVCQVRPNSQVYNGELRAPWYFNPTMRARWAEDYVKNYVTPAEPRVILGYGNAKSETFSARAQELSDRQLKSLVFMPH